MAAEAKIFDDVRREVSQELETGDRVPANRYFDGSPVYPPHFAQDFNRSFVLEPEGKPIGAVVLLHGLTDSPYSQRHIARFYRDHGFLAIVPRLPAHGTVPAALTDVEWEDWAAATRLAVREARRRIEPSAPLHLVGFSNGGALAVMYALDAIGDEKLSRPDRLVLISPMVGITRFARFAGLAGLPAILPAFAKAAWLGIVPEFNPFKYNSFPVNGARQSYRLTQALQERIARYAREGKLEQLPPILTFQSLMDFTVSTQAIISGLYSHLPANGSELVLFDVNRSAKFGPLLRASVDTTLSRILPSGPRRYRVTIITNADDESDNVVERVTEAGSNDETVASARIVVPPRILFTFARRVAISGQRRPVWGGAGHVREFRRKFGHSGAARRAQCPDCQPRLSDAGIIKSVLSVYDRPDRRGYSGCGKEHRRALTEVQNALGQYGCNSNCSP